MAAGSEGGSIIESTRAIGAKFGKYNVGKIDHKDEGWPMLEVTQLQYERQDSRPIAKVSNECLGVFGEKGGRMPILRRFGLWRARRWRRWMVANGICLAGREAACLLGRDGRLRFWPLE